MSAADEQQLILLVKEGNHDAFRQFVERYMKQSYNVAYSFLNNHHDAEEIAQEAFVRAYRSIGSFRGESEISTWLYRIVMNLSLNRLKQLRRDATRRTHTEEEMTSGNDQQSAYQNDIREHIEHALHELPTLQRAVVILRHLDGLSTKQVSGILKCSEGTVKTHLFRGLKKMRVKLNFLKEFA